MLIFNSYVKLPEGSHGKSPFCHFRIPGAQWPLDAPSHHGPGKNAERYAESI